MGTGEGRAVNESSVGGADVERILVASVFDADERVGRFPACPVGGSLIVLQPGAEGDAVRVVVGIVSW